MQAAGSGSLLGAHVGRAGAYLVQCRASLRGPTGVVNQLNQHLQPIIPGYRCFYILHIQSLYKFIIMIEFMMREILL